MTWNMKKVSAYRRSAGLAMALVMSVHMLIGPGLFCAKGLLPPFRSLANDFVVFGVIPPQHESVAVAVPGRDNSESQRDTSNCSCKKQKKCPAIPRAVITSNPTHRFDEIQRQVKTACCDSPALQATDYRFVTGRDTLLTDLAFCMPFYPATPLALTCVLLI